MSEASQDNVLFKRLATSSDDEYMTELQSLHRTDLAGFLRQLRKSPAIEGYLHQLIHGENEKEEEDEEGVRDLGLSGKSAVRSWSAYFASDLALAKGNPSLALELINRAIMLQPDPDALWELYQSRVKLFGRFSPTDEIERIIRGHPRSSHEDEVIVAELFAFKLGSVLQTTPGEVEEVFFEFLKETRLRGQELSDFAKVLRAQIKEADGDDDEIVPAGLADLFPKRSKFAVAYSSSRGRHWIATERINPGEILCVENPMPNFFQNVTRLVGWDESLYCDGCCASVNFPLPCSNCSRVCFCDACFSGGEGTNVKIHLVKCGFQSLFDSLRPKTTTTSSSSKPVNDIVDLSFKIIAAKPLRFFKIHETVLLDAEKLKSFVPSRSQQGDELQRYIYLFSLTGAEGSSNLDTSVSIATVAFLLTTILSVGGYFDADSDEEDKRLIELLLHKSLCVASRNSLPVGQAWDNPPKAFGIFPSASLINHSCCPNVSKTWNGTKVVVYANCGITKGAEICDAYARQTYRAFPREVRQNCLKQMFAFVCTCAACECDMLAPTMRALTLAEMLDDSDGDEALSLLAEEWISTTKVLCSKCGGVFPCHNSVKKCPICNRNPRVQHLMKKVQDVVFNYAKALVEGETNNVQAGFERITRAIDVADSTISADGVIPNHLRELLEVFMVRLHWKDM